MILYSDQFSIKCDFSFLGNNDFYIILSIYCICIYILCNICIVLNSTIIFFGGINSAYTSLCSVNCKINQILK